MKKWQKVLKTLVSISLIVVLSGCGMEDERLEFVAKHDEGIEPWGLQDAAVTSSTDVKESQPETQAEIPEIELEADIVGIYEISEGAEGEGNEGERKTTTSQLTAGKDYEITARVLFSADAEMILGQELDFLLELPTVVEKGKKSEFEVAVFSNGTEATRNEFAVTTTAHDLRMEYIPNTYTVAKNGGVSVTLTAGDVLWNEDASQQKQSLDYLTQVNQQLGVYEYALSYRVHTEMLDTQQEEAAMQMAEPMSVRLVGVSQQYVDERDRLSALSALNDCLRDNYFMQEAIYYEGTLYMAVEVFLPDWAREYAEQYGLMVTWYNYQDAPGCGIGVSLPTFPDNLGHAEASLENLQLITTEENENAVGALAPYPMTPLSVWAKRENEVFSLRDLALITMPTEMESEPRMNRDSVTQLLGGEIIEQLPASGSFYLVLGTELTSIEGVDGSE